MNRLRCRMKSLYQKILQLSWDIRKVCIGILWAKSTHLSNMSCDTETSLHSQVCWQTNPYLATYLKFICKYKLKQTIYLAIFNLLQFSMKMLIFGIITMFALIFFKQIYKYHSFILKKTLGKRLFACTVIIELNQ